jgi:dATP pyrophosphohydrolase
MARAPFQVLVLPYRLTPGGIEYAVFRRSDGDYWQFVAGGGEDEETPLEAARREAFEEAGLPPDSEFLALDTRNTVPVVGICSFQWGPDVLVVPEHCFGVCADNRDLSICREHTEYRWVDYDAAIDLLHWDSNKNALWELGHRLTR